MGNLTEFYDPNIGPGAKLVLPPGEYVAAATHLELRAPKNEPEGKMLDCRFRVHMGEFKGRTIRDWMTLVSVDPEKTFLGKARLKAFSLAAVRGEASATEELLTRPVLIVTTVKHDEKYGETVRVVDYRPVPPETLCEMRRAVVPGPLSPTATETMPRPADAETASVVCATTAAANLATSTSRCAQDNPLAETMREARERAIRQACERAAMRTSKQVQPPQPAA
jgi:hypothetical protein